MISIREVMNDYVRYEKPPASFIEAVNMALTKLKPLYKSLGLHKPRVAAIHSLYAGCYINGSCTDPIILLCPDSHDDEDEVLVSITHELIHAYLDSMGLDCADHDEDLVEHVARSYCITYNIDDLLNTLNQTLRKAA